MIFCAKFYFSAEMATMAIGNANPVLSSAVVIGCLRVSSYIDELLKKMPLVMHSKSLR